MKKPLQSLVAALAALSLAPAALAQITVEEITRVLPAGGTARGWFAAIDLTDPRVEILVTTPRSRPADGTPPPTDASLLRTDTWRASTQATLAVNANFYSVVSGSNADVLGLSMSDGALVSPPRQHLTNPFDPALIVGIDGRARIGNLGPADLADAWDAVAGIGPSNTDDFPGSLLVTDGVNTGATARVDPLNRNPRTAAGVNQDGTILYLVAIDGRQPAWSVGMTLPELGQFLVERGVWRAVNLDGGGSTSFLYVRPDGTVAQNRPSDGAFRAVANHLGVVIRDGGTAVPRRTRPIRGAWIRPPADIAQFQSTLATIVPAGIQDIF